MKKTLLLLWAAAAPLCAAPIPEPVIPAGAGVNIHFTTGHERDLDLIAAAGFKFIRMDFGWASTEKTKGEYNWSAYDALTDGLENRGLRALYILDYSNPLYEDTVVSKNPIDGKEHRDVASPQHPESVAAFARWAAAAVRHFKGRPILWEIWNEPNISFWTPKPDVAQYATLAMATCKAIRQADPTAAIVAPATSGLPLDFIEAFFAAGALQYLDAVTVHPYRAYNKSPETAAADYAKVRALIEKYGATEAKKKIPVLSGEWGYATHTKGISVETQAAFIVRQQLSNLLQAVPLSIWYDWKNDGPDPAEREHNFGTVTLNLEPKPAYIAIQTMTRQLSGYRIVQRVDTGNTSDYLLLLGNTDRHRKLAAWTTGETHTTTITLPFEKGALQGVTGQGRPFQPSTDGQKLVLELDAWPKYVALGADRAER